MTKHRGPIVWEMSEVASVGRVLAAWDDHGQLAAVQLADLDNREVCIPSGVSAMRETFAVALQHWVAGNSDPFGVIPLVPAPTSFSQRVREVLLGIDRGSVMTYGQVASALGMRGARAIGQCCGANPIPLVVPCHRVVAARGIGGFGLGDRAKRCLLEVEGWRG